MDFLASVPWWQSAAFYACFIAVALIYCERLHMSGEKMALVRSFYCFFTLIPLLFFVNWPTAPIFYISSIGAGLLAVWADARVYAAPKKFGAGVTSRVLPLSPLFSFMLWYAFYPEDIEKILNLGTWYVTGIVVCLLGAVLALSMLKKCHLSGPAILFLLPSLSIYVVNDVMNKTAQENSDLWGGVVIYTFILMAVGLLSLYVKMLRTERFSEITSFLFSKKMLPALPLAVTYLLVMLGRCLSMSETPNPAFTSLIGLSAPLLILIYDKVTGRPDESRVFPGVILLFFVAGLILLTAGLKG